MPMSHFIYKIGLALSINMGLSYLKFGIFLENTHKSNDKLAFTCNFPRKLSEVKIISLKSYVKFPITFLYEKIAQMIGNRLCFIDSKQITITISAQTFTE